MTLADRIKARMAQLNLSQAEVARRVGVAQPTIAKLVAGSSRSSSHLHRIARALETTPAYLAGETDDSSEGAIPMATFDALLEVSGLMLVELMGYKSNERAEAESNNGKWIPVRKVDLERASVTNFKDLRADSMRGDSMYPYLRHDDVFITDQDVDKIPVQDAAYLIVSAEGAAVRRIQRLPDGQIKVYADNSLVSPTILSPKDVHIRGRVVWRSGAL